MQICHNSHDETFRRPFGAVEVSSEVRIALRADGAGSAVLRLWRDGAGETRIPMTCEGEYFTAVVAAPDTAGLIWYYFIVTDGDGNTVFYGNDDDNLGGEGKQYDHEPPSYQITVYKKAPVPEWYKNALVYQIFPDRFARGADWRERVEKSARPAGWIGPRRVIQQDWDDVPYYTKDDTGAVTRWPFFGGTLEGVREKLPYLKSLGVTAIYFNPIFKAASNHRYDTADYMTVDPMLGEEEDFLRLIREAKEAGISVILDGVFSHTGADSIYFDRCGNYGTGACSDGDSPYRSWYRFTPDASRPYECWWGVDDLPNVEENDPGYVDFICGSSGVLRRWLDAGVRGWRLDVADELPDAFIENVRRAVKECGDNVLIGEVWEDASNKFSYGALRRYLLGDELDAAMNYPFRSAAIDFVMGRSDEKTLRRRMTSLMENYPPENFYGSLNLIGGHDRMRILTLLGGADEDLDEKYRERYRLTSEQYVLARRRLKLLSVLQYTVPGVPCVYYGDEAGCEGYPDPYNRGTYPWGREDGEILYHYRMLGTLYREHPALKSGDFKQIDAGEGVYGFFRSDGNERVLVLANPDVSGMRTVTVPVMEEYALELLSSREYDIEDGTLTVTLDGCSAVMVLLLKKPPKKEIFDRAAGVICHISSLPSGTMGADARKFVDFLADSGMKLWQILPLNPVGLGDSPYLSPAVFAGNTALIDRTDIPDMSGFEDFRRANAYWLEDYALYSALREHFGGAAWQDWPEDARDRTDLEKYRVMLRGRTEELEREQYVFFTQWAELKKYANDRGISVVGDMPVYCAPDGADTWARREEFRLDEKGRLTCRAGVPPDYFSEDGQDWGNPLYDWDEMERNGYRWWMERLRVSAERFDCTRLDHFRSFAGYYAIPAGATAKQGFWQPGAGMRFFRALREKQGDMKIIAEDLGVLDSAVYNLIKLTGFSGMNVWQFSADEMARMTPDECLTRVFYSGTHDNQTLVSWCADTVGGDGISTARDIIRRLYGSKAPWVILQLQDVLLLDDAHRLNVPGTAEGNWHWRVDGDLLTGEVARRFRALAEELRR